MPIIVPPPAPTQLRVNHASKPEMGEDEDYIDYIIRCCDHWVTAPPAAPDGFELVECTAEPRHFPLYMPVDDDLYLGHCLFCERDSMSKTESKMRCRRQTSHITGGLCTVCLPCPDCGSSDPTHYSCEAIG